MVSVFFRANAYFAWARLLGAGKELDDCDFVQ